MPLICTRCQRANPKEATYCYFDGSILPGHAQSGGPVNAGAMPFPGAFVFPSGRQCKNFDELAQGCMQEWSAAVELLQQGFFESFLGGNGRADLAMVARQGAKFPDPDRGLDMLIEKLPSKVVAPAKLQVEPQTLNLGLLKIGEDRTVELHIRNQGMRLLYGAVSVEKAPWLALGEAPGVSEKSFQCEHEATIPVLIRGAKLQGKHKSQEAKLLVESSGGSVEVIVKIDVAVKPFKDGVLAGAKTQRELAERAFKNTKESIPLFESESVRKWYESNNWEYPVKGPTAQGLAALQQFFEACGLATPPKVDIDTTSITFQGNAGGRLEHKIKIKAEKKPAYGHATCDQPWLLPGNAVCAGTSATIPVQVPRIPSDLGPSVTAKLTVVGNGRQKWIIPVTLTVMGAGAAPVASPVSSGSPLDFADPGAPVFGGAPVGGDEPDLFGGDEPSTPIRRRRRTSPMVHLSPLALLVVSLLGLVLLDWWTKPKLVKGEEEEATGEIIAVGFPDGKEREKLPPHRFGIRLNRGALLTFSEKGRSNNTVVKLDGRELILGVDGQAASDVHKANPTQPIAEKTSRGDRAWRTAWEFSAIPGGPPTIRVTQIVSIQQGDQSDSKDTCLVRYEIENKDTVIPHLVGLRFLLDTYIGNNDGVPFTVGDLAVQTKRIMGKPGRFNPTVKADADAVPDFIQALEKDDLKDPGTVAHLALKLSDPRVKLDHPDWVQLSHWPFHNTPSVQAFDQKAGWNIDYLDIGPDPKDGRRHKTKGDSAVVIYWNEGELKAGEKRHMAFAYGLGQVTSAAGDGRMALTVGGNTQRGGEFQITAYIKNPLPGMKVKLGDLPGGMTLAGSTAEQSVGFTNPERAQVTWKIRAAAPGVYAINAELQQPTGGAVKAQLKNLKITEPKGVF